MNSRQMPALAALSNLGDTPAMSGQLNSSLELDDNDLSADEDDDDLDHDLDELDAAKQQLIDGGSSSSTSLQAPPSQHGSGSGGSGGQTPGSKKDKPSYNCLLCPKSYRKRKSLLDHYKMHPGYCHDCGQRNGNTLEVTSHIISQISRMSTKNSLYSFLGNNPPQPDHACQGVSVCVRDVRRVVLTQTAVPRPRGVAQ